MIFVITMMMQALHDAMYVCGVDSSLLHCEQHSVELRKFQE